MSQPRRGALGAPTERYERGAGGPAMTEPRSGALGAPTERYERGAGGPASKR
jgi:hypothetical protein